MSQMDRLPVMAASLAIEEEREQIGRYQPFHPASQDDGGAALP
jgi:hypothetical protein